MVSQWEIIRVHRYPLIPRPIACFIGAVVAGTELPVVHEVARVPCVHKNVSESDM